MDHTCPVIEVISNPVHLGVGRGLTIWGILAYGMHQQLRSRQWWQQREQQQRPRGRSRRTNPAGPSWLRELVGQRGEAESSAWGRGLVTGGGAQRARLLLPALGGGGGRG